MPGTNQAAVDRFLKTGGMPAAPAKMLGRWHGLAGHGYALVQSKDPSAEFAWAAEWSDVRVTPVIEDGDAAKALRANRRK